VCHRCCVRRKSEIRSARLYKERGMDVSACVRRRLVKSPVISGLIFVEIAANQHVLPTTLDAKAGDGCHRNDDDDGDDVLHGNGSANTRFSRQLPGDDH